jgi:hypothetical protein
MSEEVMTASCFIMSDVSVGKHVISVRQLLFVSVIMEDSSAHWIVNL